MPRQKTEVSTWEGIFLRLPKELMEPIKAQAYHERRPINAQVTILLEHALKMQEESGVRYQPLPPRQPVA